MEPIDYSKCKIVNIRRGKGARNHIIYANLVDEKDEIVVSATLDYIVRAMKVRLPTT